MATTGSGPSPPNVKDAISSSLGAIKMLAAAVGVSDASTSAGASASTSGAVGAGVACPPGGAPTVAILKMPVPAGTTGGIVVPTPIFNTLDIFTPAPATPLITAVAAYAEMVKPFGRNELEGFFASTQRLNFQDIITKRQKDILDVIDALLDNNKTNRNPAFSEVYELYKDFIAKMNAKVASISDITSKAEFKKIRPALSTTQITRAQYDYITEELINHFGPVLSNAAAVDKKYFEIKFQSAEAGQKAKVASLRTLVAGTVAELADLVAQLLPNPTPGAPALAITKETIRRDIAAAADDRGLQNTSLLAQLITFFKGVKTAANNNTLNPNQNLALTEVKNISNTDGAKNYLKKTLLYDDIATCALADAIAAPTAKAPPVGAPPAPAPAPLPQPTAAQVPTIKLNIKKAFVNSIFTPPKINITEDKLIEIFNDINTVTITQLDTAALDTLVTQAKADRIVAILRDNALINSIKEAIVSFDNASRIARFGNEGAMRGTAMPAIPAAPAGPRPTGAAQAVAAAAWDTEKAAHDKARRFSDAITAYYTEARRAAAAAVAAVPAFTTTIKNLADNPTITAAITPIVTNSEVAQKNEALVKSLDPAQAGGRRRRVRFQTRKGRSHHRRATRRQQ